MLDFPRHKEMQSFIAELNNFYLENKQLWEIDTSWEGYEWIDANDADNNVIAYKRKAIDQSELVIVVNFSPISREGYFLNVGEQGVYKEELNSNMSCFGGNGMASEGIVETSKQVNQNGEEINGIKINLPALSGLIYRKINGRVRRV